MQKKESANFKIGWPIQLEEQNKNRMKKNEQSCGIKSSTPKYTKWDPRNREKKEQREYLKT